MRSSDLKDRIVLQRSTETRDSFGSPVPSWSTLAHVWAEIVWMPGVEAFQGDRDYAATPVTVRMRRSSDTMAVREKDRALVPLGATRLAEHLGAAETAVDVEDAGVFPPENEFAVRIGSEILLVASKSGNTLTVTRAGHGSTASQHNPGSAVIHMVPLDIVSVARNRSSLELTAVRGEVRTT